jgi:hypothetical protein
VTRTIAKSLIILFLVIEVSTIVAGAASTGNAVGWLAQLLALSAFTIVLWALIDKTL